MKLNDKKLHIALIAAASLIILISAAFFYGCGTNPTGGGSSTSGPHEYLATQSPGDAWRWTINNGTFNATNETAGTTISGTYKTLSSGFMKGLIETSTSPKFSVGDLCLFAELPGSMLLVEPSGEVDNLIIGAARAGATFNPTSINPGYSWVCLPGNAWDATTVKSYGKSTVSKEVSSNYRIISTNYALNDSITSATSETFTYSSGIMSQDPKQIYVSETRIFVGDLGSNNGGLAGLLASNFNPTGEASLVEASLAEYKGFAFDYDPSNPLSGDTRPITVSPTPGTPLSMTVCMYSNITLSTISAVATVELLSQDSTTKIVKGNFVTSTSTNPLRASAARSGSKYVFLGITTIGSTPINFFAIQK